MNSAGASVLIYKIDVVQTIKRGGGAETSAIKVPQHSSYCLQLCIYC